MEKQGMNEADMLLSACTWKNEGKCKSIDSLYDCKADVPPASPPAPCVDTKPLKKCTKWVAESLCSTQYKKAIKKCKLSCGLC